METDTEAPIELACLDDFDQGIMILSRGLQIVWANKEIARLFQIPQDEIIGNEAPHLLTGWSERILDQREATREQILESYEKNRHLDSLIFDMEGEGDTGSRHILYRSTPVTQDKYRGWRVESFVDITQVRELQAELEDQNRQLSFRNAISQVLLRAQDLPTIIDELLPHLAESVELDASFFYLAKDNSGTIQLKKTLTRDERAISNTAHRLGVSLTETAVREQKPLLMDIREHAKGQPASSAAPSHLRSFVSIPLLAHGESLGALTLASCQLEHFDSELIDFLIEIGEEIGNTLDTLRTLGGARSTHAKLEEKNRRLEATNQELEEFVYITSHDLQSPLVAIEGYLQQLRKGDWSKLGRSEQRALHRIENNIGNMHQLVEDLLELSRLRTRPPNLERFNPIVEVKKILQESQALIETTNPKIFYRKRFPEVRMDRTHFRRIFKNLFHNALKFSHPERRPIVRISVDDQTPPCFFVQDNGIGIDRPYHEQIFQPAERLEEKLVEGTGMGLFIVKKIVERYQGKIWVESKKGEGSTFYLTLPKAQVTDSESFHE